MNSRFFIGILFFFLSGISLFAAPGFQNYAPASKIFLSGSSAEVRLDVAGALYDEGSPVPAPHLNTATRTLSGAFYLSGAGWGVFDTGSMVTRLDCGAQPLSALTSDCVLTGTGWSETIGVIIFDGRVRYIPSSGTLSGSATTWIGDVSFDGVLLPLRPASLSSSTYTGVTNHMTSLQIASPESFSSSGGLWKMKFTPTATAFSRIYTGTSALVDLSLASDYDLVITDPNGSATVYSYSVANSTPSFTLDASIASSLIQSFCTSFSSDSRCPDGAILNNTVLDHIVNGLSSTISVGDGQSFVYARLRLRDKYGNQIKGGTLNMVYDTPILQNQTTITETTYFPLSLPGDAIVLSGGVLINFLDGTSSRTLSLMGQDVFYGFASYAPGEIHLKSMKYNGAEFASATMLGTALSFAPWYAIDDISTPEIHIGTGIVFSSAVSKNSSRNPTSVNTIYGFSIGSGAYATVTGFQSNPSPSCEANARDMNYAGMCDWMMMSGMYLPSVFTRVLANAGETFAFSGRYTIYGGMAYAPPEALSSVGYIQYAVDGRTIVYPSFSDGLGTSLFQNLRIRILGQAQSGGWYSGISGSKQEKSDFFNRIRKNIALLSRNRTDYTNADIQYSVTPLHIIASSFDNGRRTIVVEGDDVYVDANVSRQGVPLAIIALKNPQTGLGGVIHIADSVTDIHATLVAEKNIEGSGAHQLYIYGSILSNNTLGGSTKLPKECPYFISSCTSATAPLYDLEQLRSSYLTLPTKTGYTATSTSAQTYPDTSLIIEYDPRVLTDGPPGIDK